MEKNGWAGHTVFPIFQLCEDLGASWEAPLGFLGATTTRDRGREGIAKWGQRQYRGPGLPQIPWCPPGWGQVLNTVKLKHTKMMSEVPKKSSEWDKTHCYQQLPTLKIMAWFQSSKVVESMHINGTTPGLKWFARSGPEWRHRSQAYVRGAAKLDWQNPTSISPWGFLYVATVGLILNFLRISNFHWFHWVLEVWKECKIKPVFFLQENWQLACLISPQWVALNILLMRNNYLISWHLHEQDYGLITSMDDWAL